MQEKPLSGRAMRSQQLEQSAPRFKAMNSYRKVPRTSKRKLLKKDHLLPLSINPFFPMVNTDLTDHGGRAIEVLGENGEIPGWQTVDIPRMNAK